MLTEGRGYSPEGTVDMILESQLNGRGSLELGETPLVGYVNQTTGRVELAEKATFDLEEVLRDAKKLTDLRPEGHYMKNFFEN